MNTFKAVNGQKVTARFDEDSWQDATVVTESHPVANVANFPVEDSRTQSPAIAYWSGAMTGVTSAVSVQGVDGHDLISIL